MSQLSHTLTNYMMYSALDSVIHVIHVSKIIDTEYFPNLPLPLRTLLDDRIFYTDLCHAFCHKLWDLLVNDTYKIPETTCISLGVSKYSLPGVPSGIH